MIVSSGAARSSAAAQVGGMFASRHRKNAEPICTALAPRIRAAAMPRASAIPQPGVQAGSGASTRIGRRTTLRARRWWAKVISPSPSSITRARSRCGSASHRIYAGFPHRCPESARRPSSRGGEDEGSRPISSSDGHQDLVQGKIRSDASKDIVWVLIDVRNPPECSTTQSHQKPWLYVNFPSRRCRVWAPTSKGDGAAFFLYWGAISQLTYSNHFHLPCRCRSTLTLCLR
jgi:hypothetical protein